MAVLTRQSLVKCGRVARFRKPHLDIGPSAQFIAPHAGVAAATSRMTNEVINILMDDTLVTDSATDLGTGITDGSDRGVVFKASTHELVGTLFTGLDGKLAFREVLSSPLMPLPSFTHAEGVSARRKTAAFFDSSAPDDFDQLGLREVSMVTGLELNSTLYMPIGHAPGTITSATYRDIDLSLIHI